MTEYIPTTQRVRSRYSRDDLSTFVFTELPELQEEFDRWLAERDRQVKAEALRDFADSLDVDVIADVWAEPGSHTHWVVSNAITYVQVRALRDAAYLERRRED